MRPMALMIATLLLCAGLAGCGGHNQSAGTGRLSPITKQPYSSTPAPTNAQPAANEIVIFNFGYTVPASVVMLGVASNGFITGPDEAAYNQTVQFNYQVQDSTPLQIVSPGAYDNGPVTLSASPDAIVTISQPTSFASPAASPGTQTFSVTCVNPNGGGVGLRMLAGAQPNTAYASALTYSDANYSSGELVSAVLSCDSTPATIPVTVESRRVHPR